MANMTTRQRALYKVAAAVLLAGFALTAMALAAVASDRFKDVQSDHAHVDGITYLTGAGITAGCEDGTVFCPGHSLTRGQMATFLFRASGNDPETPPSINAATVEGFRAEDLRGEPGPAGPPGPKGEPGSPAAHTSQIILHGIGVGAILIGEEWNPACGREARLCSIPINGDAVPQGADVFIDYRFEIESEEGSVEGCLRVRNVTTGQVLPGSEVCRNQEGRYVVQVPIDLLPDRNEYVLERRGGAAVGLGSVSQALIMIEYVPG